MTSSHKKGWLQAVGAAVCLFAGLLGYFGYSTPEPIRNGKTPTDWIKRFALATPAAPLPAIILPPAPKTQAPVVIPRLVATNKTQALGLLAVNLNSNAVVVFGKQAIRRVPAGQPLMGAPVRSPVPVLPQLSKLRADPAIAEIGKFGAAAVPSLARSLRKQDSFLDTWHAKLWNKIPVAIQTQYLSAPFPAVQLRRNAASLLAVMPELAKESVPALTDALADPDFQVRATAVLALGVAGEATPQTIAGLITAARDANPIISSNAVCSLAAQNNSLRREDLQKKIASLFTALKPVGKIDIVRRIAVWQGHSSGFVPVLIPLLSDSDHMVRGESVQTLGAIGPAAKELTVPALLGALNDPEHFVRHSAVQALYAVEPREPAMIRQLEKVKATDPATYVALEAGRILLRIRSETDDNPFLMKP